MEKEKVASSFLAFGIAGVIGLGLFIGCAVNNNVKNTDESDFYHNCSKVQNVSVITTNGSAFTGGKAHMEYTIDNGSVVLSDDIFTKDQSAKVGDSLCYNPNTTVMPYGMFNWIVKHEI